RDDISRSEAWFERHGSVAVLTGRLVPVVRSFVSIPAGLEHMSLLRFVVLTALGSGAYNSALVLGGYLLGSRWTDVGRYSDLINYVVYAAIAGAIGVFVVRRLRRDRSSARPDPTPSS